MIEIVLRPVVKIDDAIGYDIIDPCRKSRLCRVEVVELSIDLTKSRSFVSRPRENGRRVTNRLAQSRCERSVRPEIGGVEPFGMPRRRTGRVDGVTAPLEGHESIGSH